MVFNYYYIAYFNILNNFNKVYLMIKLYFKEEKYKIAIIVKAEIKEHKSEGITSTLLILVDYKDSKLKKEGKKERKKIGKSRYKRWLCV